MGSVCTEFQQQQRFHQSHQLNVHKKMLREIQIPPRKLIGRRFASAHNGGAPEMFMDSFKSDKSSFRQKYLPYNNVNDDDDEDNPFTSDYFRMYEFKVRMCPRGGSHDWMNCPFAHPGEKALRRDPNKFSYSGTICPEFRKGHCSHGDRCELAHGVFESWLHPTRYRTEACKDGRNCLRRVCFFAHTPRQIRLLPEERSSPMNTPVSHEQKYVNHCCGCCHSNNFMTSPNSTLMGVSQLSPPISPPISPENELEFPPLSRYGSVEYCHAPAELNSGGTSYKDNLTQLMNSMEAMNITETSSSAKKWKSPWIDLNFKVDENQPHFLVSPSTLNQSPGAGTTSKFFDINGENFMENNNGNGLRELDLKWINDLVD
ncbi:Zinc finger CCCH domain-containing protein 2 [Abeliophyllum distichum]|uniref:Zinc finger CCCH domain-containing protein 2 n=1 Tax=Abeliophyllum distichum TaxID=126358 RepID=A0ABD1UHU0_9LAMI